MAYNNTKGLRITEEGNLIIQSKHQANGAIIGMMLGDSSMSKYVVNSKRFDGLSERRRSRIRLSTTHCPKQLEYLLWKESIIKHYVKLGELVTDSSKSDEGFTYYKKTSLVESTKNLVYLYENFYAHGKKRVTSSILNRLTNLGIAIWFMDDGSLVPHSYRKDGSIRAMKLRLHTSSFSYDEHVTMKQYFDKLGINFNINFDRSYYILSTGMKESISKFVNIVKPFVDLVDCMKYKVNPYDVFASANYPYCNDKDKDIV
jgi:hypothetical protein